jgi:hypothetical protein
MAADADCISDEHKEQEEEDKEERESGSMCNTPDGTSLDDAYGGGGSRLACHLCGKIFGGHQAGTFKAHYVVHHFKQALRQRHLPTAAAADDADSLLCQYCGQKFGNESVLVYHLGVTHDLVRPLLPHYIWQAIEVAGGAAKNN